MKKSFWKKQITRREFIIKGAAAAAGIGIGAYFLKKAIRKPDATPELWKWSHEAYHYKTLGKRAQCEVCPNQCVLEEGNRSICRNKVGKDGKIYTLVYGNPAAVHIDPIEKKPLYHFLPLTKAFSIGTSGCNLRCLNCQNWEMSQQEPEKLNTTEMFPEQVVSNARNSGSKSIAYTYNEPISFYEYMYDTAKLAKEEGIRNVMVTNGYINKDAFKDLSKHVDALSINLKTFDDKISNELNRGSLKPVLDTIKLAKQEGLWLEVINLVVPQWTDKPDMIREMSKWLYKNIGADYPLHFSRFFPMYKLVHLPQTPLKTLESARKIAMEEGLKYVYIGNVPGTEYSNTICPKCFKAVVERKGYELMQNNIQEGSCRFCGERIAGVWG
ncbi:MAG: AmmeMemoRadiSam system radical SAM enzyme [Candidatus Woesearchaeota archaeon]